jgi:hypothetical protein
MIMKIGIVAGEIWHYLDNHGEVKFSELVKNIDRPRELLFMSVGWLAREGHVILNQEQNDYRVSLRR